MNKHPWIVFALVLVAGCASKPSTALPPMGSGQAFIKQWQANLDVGRSRLTALYVQEGAVIAYTSGNRGYWLSATGGEILGTEQIVSPGYVMFPPVVLANHTVIPTSISLESFDNNGKRIDSFKMPSAVQSPAIGAGEAVYLGVTRPGSGRLAKFNVGTRLNMAWEMYTTDGVVAAPALFGDAIFCGGLDGRVYAVSSARLPIWPLEQNSFKTHGPISADLAADEFGVYVASQDKRLYCLDRNSGRVKWMYFADAPLLDHPVVSGNMVYQLVPNVGMVAINKTEGKMARPAMWTQPLAQQVLAVDEQMLYVRSGRGTVLALDKTTGQPVFHSTRDDLDVFATNTKSSTIYAATRNGAIMAMQAVLKPGTVGEIVWNQQPMDQLLAMGQ